MSSLVLVFGSLTVVQGLNSVLTGINKTLEVQDRRSYSLLVLNLLGLILSGMLSLWYEYGLWGIWMGWLVSMTLALLVNLKKILFMDFEDTY